MEPRKVVGSVDTGEFLVSLGASLGFLFSLGSERIEMARVAALLAGGVVAAPLAAWVVRKLPPRILGSAVGSVILITNAEDDRRGRRADRDGRRGRLRRDRAGVLALLSRAVATLRRDMRTAPAPA